MKTIKKQATMWTLALITLMTMFSCDEDWWNDWDGGSDITGQWRIVETTGYGPYRQDDYWTFYKTAILHRGIWHTARARTLEHGRPTQHTNVI